MALTEEQTSQVELETAMNTARITTAAASRAEDNKLQLLRMAKEILVENRRTQAAAEATDITSSAVTTLAGELNTFVTS